jgi:hypothetical protein
MDYNEEEEEQKEEEEEEPHLLAHPTLRVHDHRAASHHHRVGPQLHSLEWSGKAHGSLQAAAPSVFREPVNHLLTVTHRHQNSHFIPHFPRYSLAETALIRSIFVFVQAFYQVSSEAWGLAYKSLFLSVCESVPPSPHPPYDRTKSDYKNGVYHGGYHGGIKQGTGGIGGVSRGVPPPKINPKCPKPVNGAWYLCGWRALFYPIYYLHILEAPKIKNMCKFVVVFIRRIPF